MPPEQHPRAPLRKSAQTAPVKTRIIPTCILTGAVIALSFLAGCESGPTPTPATAIDGVLDVEMRNYLYEPEALQFETGETVEFRLLSVDESHTFTVRDLGINWVVPKEEEPQAQTFTFDRAGTFRLVCIIPGHEGSGMVGTITVVE